MISLTRNDQEIESKFFVTNLSKIEARLISIDAHCILERCFEYNLRFDNPQNSLSRQHRVLRLRKSNDIRLTYKGPGERVGGALSRKEIELVIDNFDSAQKFLESLGYKVTAVYEKYRAIYKLGTALITLDELPFGNFVEIEAETPEQISELAPEIGLNPQAAIPSSYQGLFENIKTTLNLKVSNLTFWEFEKLHITPLELGVVPAD